MSLLRTRDFGDDYPALPSLTGEDSVRRALRVLADTFVANLTPEEAASVKTAHRRTANKALDVDDAVLDAFLSIQASDIEGQVDRMLRTLQQSAPKDKFDSLMTTLALLDTTVGTVLLCGTGFKKLAPFTQLDRPDREVCIQRLASSQFEVMRLLAKSFRTLSVISAAGVGVRMPAPGNPNKTVFGNPFWSAMQFSGSLDPEIPVRKPEDAWRPPFLDTEEVFARTAGSDGVGKMHYDIVVIGSGAGGGLLAAELSKTGKKVLLMDKAVYMHPTELPPDEYNGLCKLYENNASIMSETGGIQILAGSAWGGGTSVNWSASLVPPESLRKEWAEKYGLKFFATPEFQKSVDAICQRTGVTASGVEHNPSNQLFLDGCKALGYVNGTIPQNTRGKKHACHCMYGCRSCEGEEKQGSLQTWIKDAVAAGCHLMQDAYANRVLFKNGIVTGVDATVGSKRFVISAGRVVVSCGSINSPALLLRSRVPNPNIGRKLKLHPVSIISGYFPDGYNGKHVDPCKGAIMTAISDQFTNLHGDGYGVPAEFPALFAVQQPWRSAAEYKRLLLRYPNKVSVIALARDDDSEGTVYIDAKTGKPRVNWKLSNKDAKSILEGLVGAANILVAAGAKSLSTCQLGVPTFECPVGLTPAQALESNEFKRFIAAVREAGIVENKVPILCAHQMGSCRMATSPKTGVVNPRGESWEVKRLHVADASVFPTSSGVNPMMTTFSVAHSIAQFIKQDIAREGAKL
nr:hypothetical protein HK105_001241 [Polyrhizophydium stewartii]